MGPEPEWCGEYKKADDVKAKENLVQLMTKGADLPVAHKKVFQKKVAEGIIGAWWERKGESFHYGVVRIRMDGDSWVLVDLKFDNIAKDKYAIPWVAALEGGHSSPIGEGWQTTPPRKQ